MPEASSLFFAILPTPFLPLRSLHDSPPLRTIARRSEGTIFRAAAVGALFELISARHSSATSFQSLSGGDLLILPRYSLLIYKEALALIDRYSIFLCFAIPQISLDRVLSLDNLSYRTIE